jgi:hypothetical protein
MPIGLKQIGGADVGQAVLEHLSGGLGGDASVDKRVSGEVGGWPAGGSGIPEKHDAELSTIGCFLEIDGIFGQL